MEGMSGKDVDEEVNAEFFRSALAWWDHITCYRIVVGSLLNMGVYI